MIPLPLVFVCLLIRLAHEEGGENSILPIFPFHLATVRFFNVSFVWPFWEKDEKISTSREEMI